MAGLQLSGLASNFDWKSLVDQLVALERAPISRIQAEQQKNDARAGALATLSGKVTALSAAVSALNEPTAFGSRSVTSSAVSGAWAASSSPGGAVGTNDLAVTQLASFARLVGASDLGRPLSASEDVSGLTLATLRGATAITAGTFSVNGHQVTISTSDSLQDVFAAVETATSGDVVAAYDPASDRITLSSVSSTPISLGAANDSSNLLRVLKLANTGGAVISSGSSIAALSTTSALVSAGLAAAITNVDASGNGSFQINGVSIAYNVNSDSIGSVIRSINGSGAGVSAAYDAANDRVVLTNNRPGDLGVSVSESGAGLLSALGLTNGATLQRGGDALFSVNGGAVRRASGNTLDEGDHGIAGLSVTLSSTGTQTLTVDNDTSAMRRKIDAFVSAYNSVQAYIDDQTKTTSANGKVTAGVLSATREVQEWARDLRQLVFGPVAGLSQSITRLDGLGLGFSGLDGNLKVLDEAKLTKALADRPGEVEAFFQHSSSGLAVKLGDLLERVSGASVSSQKRLSGANTDLDRQIADLERRIAQQKQVLTDSFVAMESAQARIQQQGTAITNAFFPSNK